MKRTVNRRKIDEWIEDNAPDGIAKLAVASNVSSSTIGVVRRNTSAPTPPVRRALARVIGCTEDDLFPVTEKEIV